MVSGLLETNPAVITIHARTRKKCHLFSSLGTCERAVEIRDSFVDSSGKKSETLIFGNGDVVDLDEC